MMRVAPATLHRHAGRVSPRHELHCATNCESSTGSAPTQSASISPTCGVVRGDLGNSIRTKQPVREIGPRLPATICWQAPASLSVDLGLTLGVLAAVHRRTTSTTWPSSWRWRACRFPCSGRGSSSCSSSPCSSAGSQPPASAPGGTSCCLGYRHGFAYPRPSSRVTQQHD